MANSLSRAGVWVIDTAAATVIDARHLKILTIRWVDAVSAGDDARLTDKNGERIWSAVAADVNNEEEVFRNQWVDGLICPTLTSGYLEVTLA